MERTVRLAIWNIEGRLALSPGDAPRSTPGHIVTEILLLQADIIFLPEAHNRAQLSPKIRQQFEAVGHEVIDCAYADKQRVKSDPQAATHSVILSRFPVVATSEQRYDLHRTLPVANIKMPGGRIITVAGIHLDDRSEAARVGQVRQIIKAFQDTKSPLVLMGDFNAMHRRSLARLYSSSFARMAAKRIPHTFIRSVATRFTDMASGTALRMLSEELPLRDADYRHQPTVTPKMRYLEKLPSIPLAQIDHIFCSPQFIIHDVEVMPDGGSDHRAVVCDITLDKS